MTTQMNFGPEWMRGGEVSKRNSQFTSNFSNQHTDNNTSNNDSTYKYSKEYMLSLYKSVDMPVDIEHHEYVVTSEGQSPLSLETLDTTTMNDTRLKFKSDKDFSSFTGRSNLLSKGGDNFDFMNEFRRGNEVLDEPLWSGVNKDNVGTFDSNGVFHLGGGGADNSLESSLEPEEDEDDFNFDFRQDPFNNSTTDQRSNGQLNNSVYFGNSSASLMTTTDDSQRSYQWIYRDRSGNVQGPFSSLEMQEWFEAGFFDHSLIVKREDAPFLEPLSVLIRKVKNAKIPFLAPWPQQQQPDRKQPPTLLPTTNLFTDSSFLGNHTLDRLPHQDNTLDTFNNTNSFTATKSNNMGTPQSPFGNPPFVSSPLPRVNPMNNRITPLSSPWENNSNNQNSSWLSSQNDPLYNSNNRLEQQQQPTSRQLQRDSLYNNENNHGGGFATDYQQQVMNQQMEQQYLNMLRQNQQQHIQLQQRMLQQQQQQQQILLQQQQRQMFNQQRMVPPPLPLQQQQSINRGWSSVPGTPGLIDPMQSPWNVTKFNDAPFVVPGFQSPRQSQSPTNIILPPQQKTQVEDKENDDQLAYTLNSMSITTESKPDPVVEESTTIEAPQKTVPEHQQPEKQQLNNESSSAPNSSTWGSTTAHKKTLREIQLEEEASSHDKKASQVRSNTWSSVSAATKPVQRVAAPIPSFSTNTRVKPNAWETPVRQKRASMNASIPSTSISTPRSSRHPTIKSEPKGPSEDFLKWCKLSLRGLNPGVNVDEILQMLLSFPVDNSCAEIIQDIIYANSQSMDGRRFASDYMTRRKADLDGKLVLSKANDHVSSSSEFKVVTKKGKKKQQQ